MPLAILGAVTPEELTEMLRRDRHEWDALAAVLDARPSGTLHDPESPAWDPSDIYAHFARWIHNSTDALEAWRDGRRLIPSPEGTDNVINARWQAEDTAVSFTEARERANSAFTRRIAAIEAVPAARWDPMLQKLAEANGYQHYSNHRRNVETGSVAHATRDADPQ